MKCEMCGYEFEAESCSSCGSSGCGGCQCPVCGYSPPPPSRIAAFIDKLRGA